MPQFKIGQLALALPLNAEDHTLALKFLAACGIRGWVEDTVCAQGTVNGCNARNTAKLRFNYDTFLGNELELLNYTQGPSWLNELSLPTVSHIGMHCTEPELLKWRQLMADFRIEVAQEVWTESHTNPRIRDCRRYHYVIFSTRELIGVDMKFIVRSIIDPAEEARQMAAEEERLG